MFHNRTLEISVGIFVALGLAAIFILAIKVSNLSSFGDTAGYPLEARFDNIGGLKAQAPVTMAGVRVGRVEQIAFDSQTYEAVVTLKINNEYNRLPLDSSASIFTSGLLGEQYIALEAGGDPAHLKANDHIIMTQSALVLEQMIGQFLFKSAAEGSDSTEAAK